MRKTAFTLVELLIVIIIIGILATMAVPQYTKMVWRTRFAEVYNIVGTIARAEGMFYTEYGYYALASNLNSDNFVGNGITAGSTKIQQDLGINIPSNCFFLYSVCPQVGYPEDTFVYFRDVNYPSNAFRYDYTLKKWQKSGTNGGPAQTYFVPPA